MTSAEQVSGNGYLLEEILIRLPAKSLTRSKVVSKQWLSHISDPQFVQHHYQQQNPNKSHTGMFLTDFNCSCRNADFVSFNELNPTYQTIPSLGFLYHGIRDVSEITIIDCCNGLFLLNVSWNNSSSKYCVCNPTTKTFRLLPPGPVPYSGPLPDSYPWNRLCINHYLAFDSCVSLHYKVICITRTNDSVKLDIYSSEDQAWKKTIVSSVIPYPYVQGFFLNGAIYWLSPEYNTCFDVYNEEMKQIDVPPNYNACYFTSLAVVGSHLYYLAREGASGGADFCIREMSSDFSEWVTKYDDSVDPLLPAFPQIYGLFGTKPLDTIHYCFTGICVVEGMKEDEAKLVIAIPDKVLLYDFKDKTAKELYNLTGELGGQSGYTRARFFQFIETLYVV